MSNIKNTNMKNTSVKKILAQKPILLNVSNNICHNLPWGIQNAGICSSCGEKYSGCLYKLTINKFLCTFCYLVQYLNLADVTMIKLYYSKLNQSDIIKITKTYYDLYRCIPSPQIVDPNVIQAAISLTELIYLLKDDDTKKWAQEKNYKIFYTNNLATGFLDSNSNCFDSSDEESIDQEIDVIVAKKQILTLEERTYLKTIF